MAFGWRNRRDRVVVAAVIALVSVPLGVLTVAAVTDREPSGPLPLVYVSGLDDHLLDAYRTVPLHAEPGGEVIAQAPVDSLARVHAEDGQWLDVELVAPAAGPDGEAGEPLQGWIADFHLRGELHVVDPDAPGCPVPTGHEPGETDHRLDPSTRVRLVDLADRGSDAWVLVRAVGDGSTSWVHRDVLSERPGPDVRRAEEGTACADIHPEPATPHTH